MRTQGSTASRISLGAVRTAALTKKHLIDVPGTVVTSCLTFPGLCLRLGMRVVVARVFGTTVEHADLKEEFGGVPVIGADASRRAQVWVLLGAPLLLVPIGFIVALPLIVDYLTIGTPVLPTGLNDDAFVDRVILTWMLDGQLPGIRMWVALSCWYAALLPHGEVLKVRTLLSGSPRASAFMLRSALAPVQWAGRLLSIPDWFGYIGSGTVSVLFWGVLCITTVRVVVV